MTIRELRMLTGLSQHKFAEKYHISYRNIQNWEQGARQAPDYVCHLLERIIKEVDYQEANRYDELCKNQDHNKGV